MGFVKDLVKILLLIVVSHLFGCCDAACQTYDASWDADRGPLVTQPSKSDPSKVMINWANIITNANCVDQYSLWVWRKGTPKERGLKHSIPDKDSVSFIAEVEACVDYSFAVEFVERNVLWAPTIRDSPSTNFKTEAIPMLRSRDKSLFTVGYYFDSAKGLHDLSKVSIKFPKKILDHPNCIKHLEIKGHVDMTPAANDVSQSALSKMSGKKKKKEPKVKKGDANSTIILTAANLNVVDLDDMYPDHHHEHGWHGRPGFVAEQPAASAVTTTPPPKKKSKRSPGLFSKSTTTVKPAVVASPAPTPMTATVAPPFLFETIEAVIEGAEPCRAYIFNMKVVSPRNAIMGEVEGLHLPSLNNILDYHPPSLKSLFQVEMSGGQPNIKWQQGLGVPAACLPTFFEAVDLHMARLEDDITHHVGKEFDTKLHVGHYNNELGKAQSLTLTNLGCKCNSTVIRLTSTDPIAKNKIPHLLGSFHFDSVHQGKPFYRMPSKLEDAIPDYVIPPPQSPTPAPHHSVSHGYPQSTRVKRFIGKIPGSPTGSNTNPNSPPSYPPPPTPTNDRTTSSWYFPTPAPTIRPNPQQPQTLPPYTKSPTPTINPPPIATPTKMAYFLYWDPLEKQWLISNILGGAQPWAKSQKNPPFVCPADPGNMKFWTYEDRGKTTNWVTDVSLKFECGL